MHRASLLLLFVVAACADGGGAAASFTPTPGSSASGETSSGETSSGSAEASTAAGSSSGVDSSGEMSTSFDPSTTGEPVACGAGLTACGVLCVDTTTDPTNCGGCGITCVVPGASAVCEAGGCAIGSCDAGTFDCDGLPANGCEATEGCSPGGPCMTSCGSEGVTSCRGCDAVCELPAETCNAIDDDCNGSCDEGGLPGCRQGVHRAVGPNGHYYTNVLAETSEAGRTLEHQDYWWMYAEQHPGLSALYRCDLGSGRFFLTTSNTCEGAGSIDATLGYLSPGGTCGSTALYRLLSPQGRHFYTISAAERDNAVNSLGYTLEATAGHVWTGS